MEPSDNTNDDYAVLFEELEKAKKAGMVEINMAHVGIFSQEIEQLRAMAAEFSQLEICCETAYVA